MKSEKILLIINPVSGRMKTKTGLFEILDELYRLDPEETNTVTVQQKAVAKPAGPSASLPSLPFGNLTASTLGGDADPDRRVTVAPTMHRGHASRMAATAAEEGYDTVICCGGDGTFNETVSGLMSVPCESRPALGYIPAGSTNDFAASIGLSGSLRGASRTAVGEHETAIDIGFFSPYGMGHPPARYFTYIASFGAFTAASYSTSQTAKNLFGHVAYLVSGIKDIANIQPHHAAFDLPDGTHIEGDYIFGAITNTTSAGGVIKLPADLVCMSDGQLELFLIHTPKSAADLQKIASALLAQDFDGCPLIELHHIRSVKILMDENLSWSLDGEEAQGSKRIEIKCLDNAVRLKTNP
ncbi:MAG: YegS/Rv2252/BmrU family lipid kinase [Clostridia bacterium]|nr:YegS/Rv2252/BmrU family lipid kinase [Clostridia bacterium]